MGKCDCKVIGNNHDDWCSSHPANILNNELAEVTQRANENADACEALSREIDRLRDALAESEKERLEQARLLGMSGERELALQSRLSESQKANERLKENDEHWRNEVYKAWEKDKAKLDSTRAELVYQQMHACKAFRDPSVEWRQPQSERLPDTRVLLPNGNPHWQTCSNYQCGINWSMNTSIPSERCPECGAPPMRESEKGTKA